MLLPLKARAGAAELLPTQVFEIARAAAAPTANAAFAPGDGALPAPPFTGVLKIHAVQMQTLPVLQQPLIQGRDARIFPAVQLEFFTVGDLLVPVQRGEMVRESGAGSSPAIGASSPSSAKFGAKRRTAIGRALHSR
jgi:hypothetical protein